MSRIKIFYFIPNLQQGGIERMQGLSQEERRAMGALGRARVYELFARSPALPVDETLVVYERLPAEKGMVP
ncbi:MAG TPA: hypothetical protein PK668_13020 [Myxococcota bacterium]|nr:hypothetical protein [Myxococcota bacterium]HRY93609.1 hypothetical protein [Myxococcota bacterium]